MVSAEKIFRYFFSITIHNCWRKRIANIPAISQTSWAHVNHSACVSRADDDFDDFCLCHLLDQNIFGRPKKYLAGQNFLDLHFYIGFWWFWPAKSVLASQNWILAGQKNFGRADGIGIGIPTMRATYHIWSVPFFKSDIFWGQYPNLKQFLILTSPQKQYVTRGSSFWLSSYSFHSAALRFRVCVSIYN